MKSNEQNIGSFKRGFFVIIFEKSREICEFNNCNIDAYKTDDQFDPDIL